MDFNLSNNDSIICFLPCREGSERVKNKNIKQFGESKFGLIEIKINQLLNCTLISKIVLSTNDDSILEYARKLNNTKILIHKRDNSLCTNLTTTDDLILHASDLIKNAHILWTHVTSPFISNVDYENMIRTYFDKIKTGYDSLMTVNEIRSFVWKNNEPINYKRSEMKWPRTQTLEPLHEINSGVFLAHSSIYIKNKDRIGDHPFLYKLDKIRGHDIDWPEDFVLGELINKMK